MTSYPSSADDFDALTSHPGHWFARQVAVYTIAAIVTALIFLVGAALYARLPAKEANPPEPKSLYDRLSPPLPLPRPQRGLGSGPLIADLSGSEIGVPIYKDGRKVGYVAELKESKKGERELVITRSDGIEPSKTVVPYDAVQWRVSEETVVSWQGQATKVIGSVKDVWGDLNETGPRLLLGGPEPQLKAIQPEGLQ